MKRCLLLLGALFVASPVFAASSQVAEKPLVAQSLDSFNTEAAKIREQMRPGGVYDHIAPKDKGRVEERLDQMQKLLSAHSADGDLRREDKVALLNAQEEVNGILRHNDNNRLVCEHTAPVGSHVPKTTCRTYGEVLEQQRADQKFLQDRALYNHN
jgi:hypothetical protein